MRISKRMKRRDVLKASAAAVGTSSFCALGTLPLTSRRSEAATLQRRLKTAGIKPLFSSKSAQETLDSPQSVHAPSAQLPVPQPAIRALRRLTYGYQSEDLAAFNALGNNFDQRLENYVNAQLNGYQGTFPPGNDPALTAELNKPGTGFTTLDDSLAKLWQERVKAEPGWPHYYYPLVDTQYLTLLRCVYSKWQLAEVLADFWHTHFSVQGSKYEVAPVFVHYDRDVIRPHMLGNFRQMLEAVTKSTAMLRYLDNASSTKWGPNENFARELQELHTLGAAHSYRFAEESAIPDAVPMPGSSANLPAGLKAGYAEHDVRQATLALTGWTISTQWSDGLNTGQYIYHSNWHDNSSKRYLGIDISVSGEAEVGQMLDRLAIHPNTARYVCAKLCKRLIGDHPPESIVEAAATVFNDKWQAPDQLRQVVKAIILSDEFKDPANWGAKSKKPFELIAGTLRSCGGVAGKLVRPYPSSAPGHDQSSKDYAFSRTLNWMLGDTGNHLFNWATPDGYPDSKPAWLGSTPLVMAWRTINSVFASGYRNPAGNWEDFYPVDAVAISISTFSASERSARNLVNYWVKRILGYDAAAPDTPQLDEATRNKLIAFMQQDAASPDTALDLSEAGNDWGDNIPWQAYPASRLQTLVASIAMLPDNLKR